MATDAEIRRLDRRIDARFKAIYDRTKKSREENEKFFKEHPGAKANYTARYPF
ncbi:MAG: hypothetical protein LBO04_03300 [Spirochaetaceae bacterium]|nr:hypothetical protein [Spirochaetaceae bacterium]